MHRVSEQHLQGRRIFCMCIRAWSQSSKGLFESVNGIRHFKDSRPSRRLSWCVKAKRVGAAWRVRFIGSRYLHVIEIWPIPTELHGLDEGRRVMK